MTISKRIWPVFLIMFGLICCNALPAEKEEKKDKKAEKESGTGTTGVNILDKWEMPAFLTEISGIAYLDDNRFACVQDESGVVFIYNTKTSQIELQVTFGASGDYEGIALVDKVAYVVRSDGKIFEVNDITTRSPRIKEYSTSLTAKNDVEGVTYDKKQNRLLIAIKGNETEDVTFKGIYAFDLNTKKLASNPVYKIDLEDEVFSGSKSKKIGSRVQPSDIAVHPVTGDIYILEGTNPQLLILDENAKIKNQYKLKGSDFSQPEGMTFSPAGDLFISNEGKKGKGNILKLNIN